MLPAHGLGRCAERLPGGPLMAAPVAPPSPEGGTVRAVVHDGLRLGEDAEPVLDQLPVDRAPEGYEDVDTRDEGWRRSSSTRRWQGCDMAGELNGRRVAILAAYGVERVEIEKPRQALDEAGARTEVLSIKSGEIAARNHDLEDAG
ncbi:MAG: pfpI, partial [Frankiales bacterium]|nr:pfpI [Frankiales bacterium]